MMRNSNKRIEQTYYDLSRSDRYTGIIAEEGAGIISPPKDLGPRPASRHRLGALFLPMDGVPFEA